MLLHIRLLSIFPIIAVSLAYTLSPPTYGNVPPAFSHLTTENGLSSNSSAPRENDTILEDSRGFIWIGTQNGLSRYDGYRFKNYYHDPQNSRSISDNYINSLYEDSAGILWIGTKYGLNKFEHTLEKFIHYPLVTSGEVLSINNIVEESPGKLWVATDGDGLFTLDTRRGLATQFKHDPDVRGSISSNVLSELYIDSQGKLWAGTENGLNLWNPDNKQFTYYLPDSDNPAAIRGHIIFKLLEDSRGGFWVGTEKGLNRFDRESGQFYHHYMSDASIPFSSYVVTDIVQDANDTLWFSLYGGGLCELHLDTKILTNYRQSTNTPNGLTSDAVSSLFIDSNDKIWVNTMNGVNYFSPHHRSFVYGVHDAEIDGQRIPRPVLSLLVDSHNNLWAGTFGGGVSRRSLDSNNEDITYFIPGDNTHGMPGKTVFSIFEDRENYIWVAPYNHNLVRFEPENNRFVKYNSSDKIGAIAQDRDGRLWLGDSRTGLGYLNIESNEFKVYQDKDGNKITGSIIALLIDNNNIMWVGTIRGIYRVDLSKNEFTLFEHTDEAKSLSQNAVLVIYQDSKEQIWVGTEGGLNRFNQDTQDFQSYHISDGLPSNKIGAIIEDDNQTLWISTDKGLAQFDEAQQRFRSYSREDGLYVSDFPGNGVAKSQNGDLFFGGHTNYVQFNPNDILTEIISPKLSFTDFNLFNQTVTVGETNSSGFTLTESIASASRLKLSHRERFFSFEFAVLNALKPERVEYSYMLEGWDEEWIRTTYDNRIASYTNIPAGNYILKVKANDQDGFWSGSTTSKNILILPPPWRTTWAYLAYCLLVLACVFIVIQLRTRWLQKRAEELEQTVQLRTQEIANQKKTIESLLEKKDVLFANVSHEFRTPLTLIIGPVSKLIRESKNAAVKTALEPTLANAKRLLRLVDQLLDLARLDSSSQHNTSVTNVSRVVEECLHYFDHIFDERKLRLSQVITPSVLVNIAPDAFQKIFINLLSNAIKYTPEGGAIEIGCSTRNNTCYVYVKDSGIGIPEESQERIFERFTRLEHHSSHIPGAGVGLALAKELVENNKGRVHVKSESTKGSCFTVEFPLAKSVSNDDKNHRIDISPSRYEQNHLEEQYFQPENNLTPAKQTVQSDEQKPKLLIIEDNADMRQFIHESLAGHFDCYLTKNGVEGIQAAINDIPDLIITDLMMPEKNGFEVAEVIRNDTRTSHIPIIMLTARADRETRQHAWKTDIDEYFEKPFRAEELLIRSQNLLSIRQLITQKIGSDSGELKDNTVNLLSKRDQDFISKLKQLVEKNYSDTTLSVKLICDKLGLSESQLHRKTKALLGQSIPQYIRIFRLKKASELLLRGERITTIALDVGFSSSTYFSSCFKAYYGMTPKAYQATRSTNTSHSSQYTA